MRDYYCKDFMSFMSLVVGSFFFPKLHPNLGLRSSLISMLLPVNVAGAIDEVSEVAPE